MSNRRLIRPNLADIKDRAPGKPRRKPAPPEVTNAEAFYYVKQINARTPVVVVLNDGEEIEGVIEWYDRRCIKLNREGDPDLLLMKHAISYIYKQDEEQDDEVTAGPADVAEAE